MKFQIEFEPVSEPKLKFPFTSKQKYNSKFQEFETIRILKIQKRRNSDQKTLPKINNHEKNQQKKRKEKRRQSSKTPPFFFILSSFFVFISHHHLYKYKKIKIINYLCDFSVRFVSCWRSWRRVLGSHGR